MRPANSIRLLFLIVSGVFFFFGLGSQHSASAGGPLLVGSPTFGNEGQPFTWDSSIPVPYRVDGGPLSINPTGAVVVDNSTAIARVQAMFQVWEDVPTATLSYTNAGPIMSTPAFTDGDVSTVTEFNDVDGSCNNGTQSPIVFDADGSIFAALIGDPNVIGFAGTCSLDATGRITSGIAALNGRFQDGIEDFNVSPQNFELTVNEFDETFVHEFGHFSGLDHSQINVGVLNQTPGNCSIQELTGLPLMFPFAFCQARLDAGLPQLAPDDIAWISKLYPDPSFSSSHGTISGFIFFSDGDTQAQGVNVIARQVGDPRGVAVSAVSGYLFTGNPGQSVTANYLPCDPPSVCPGGFAGNNSGGSLFGSRDPLLIGFYEIPVPAGDYTVEVESIDPFFAGGSSVGPLNPPISNPGVDEKWDLGESATDNPPDSSPITVSPGGLVPNINLILNDTGPRFDSLESSDVARLSWQQAPPPVWLREEHFFSTERGL